MLGGSERHIQHECYMLCSQFIQTIPIKKVFFKTKVILCNLGLT